MLSPGNNQDVMERKNYLTMLGEFKIKADKRGDDTAAGGTTYYKQCLSSRTQVNRE